MSQLSQLNQKLKSLRDDLKVRTHLLSMELQEEWGELEQKWENLTLKIGRIKESSEDSLENIDSATKLLLEELQNGYHKIKEEIEKQSR